MSRTKSYEVENCNLDSEQPFLFRLAMLRFLVQTREFMGKQFMYLFECPLSYGLGQIVFKMSKMDVMQLDTLFTETQAHMQVYDAVVRILTTISGKSVFECQHALRLTCLREARELEPKTHAEAVFKAIMENVQTELALGYLQTMLYDLITEPEEYLAIYTLLAELARVAFEQQK